MEKETTHKDPYALFRHFTFHYLHYYLTGFFHTHSVKKRELSDECGYGGNTLEHLLEGKRHALQLPCPPAGYDARILQRRCRIHELRYGIHETRHHRSMDCMGRKARGMDAFHMGRNAEGKR